jgi:hypothetical protein
MHIIPWLPFAAALLLFFATCLPRGSSSASYIDTYVVHMYAYDIIVVYTYTCAHVCMHVCMHACMHLCTYVRVYGRMYVCRNGLAASCPSVLVLLYQ